MGWQLDVDTIKGFGFAIGLGTARIQDSMRFLQAHADTLARIGGEKLEEKAGRLAEMARKIDASLFREDTIRIEGVPPFPAYSAFFAAANAHVKFCEDCGFTAIAMIIAEETGLEHIQYFTGSDGSTGYVMLPEMMPWEYSRKEKGLHHGDLCRILEEYSRPFSAAGPVTSITIRYVY